MTKLQFRVLYREFLFRMVDLELLSARGDTNKLLGQFAAFLMVVSIFLAILANTAEGPKEMPHSAVLIRAWPVEHSLIAITMLVVGLFSVLSWDSTFPNRRDVLVLAPLPVRARTIFLAKVTASAMALSLTVAALNALPSIIFAMALAPADSGGWLSLILSLMPVRCFAAYWITMLTAGLFVFCCVLGVQGLASQLLSRRHFLRLSAFLQMGAFCLFLSITFLEPSLSTPQLLAAPENQTSLAWLPSYWFLGFFQFLNGSMHPALVPLANRALVGLPLAVIAAGAALLLSYLRTLRKIVEEPDISPGSRSGSWLPPFGTPLKTAVVQFSIRTLLRSRQHRIILAFYWGLGTTLVVLLSRAPSGRHQSDIIPMLFASIMLMLVAVTGARVVFSLPLELRANWIFRMAPLRSGELLLAATRRSLWVLSVAPVLSASAVTFLYLWNWAPAVRHLLVLLLFGIILAEVCLLGFRKIPFTCSYLPGKSYAHMVLLASILPPVLLISGARYEWNFLQHPARYAMLFTTLCVIALCAHRYAAVLARRPESSLQFEDEPAPALQGLGLYRDGVL
jgi:hypothetical protein